MNVNIKHHGIVDDVTDDCVKVRIVQSSACASCKVAGHCNASESKEKIVEVYTPDARRYSVGDSVVVIASQRTGLLAVFLSSVVPLVLLVTVLAVTLAITGSEPAAAAAGLCSLVPYYAVLYLFRNKIRARLSFSIERDGGVLV